MKDFCGVVTVVLHAANSEPEELTEVPEENVIVLDNSLNNQSHLLNVVSLERYRLPPGGRWQLEFDGDGDGVAAEVGPLKHTPVIVNNVMQKLVFQGNGGFFWLCWTQDGNEVQEPLEAKKTRYTTLDVTVPSRELGTPDPWHCFIMVVPRQSILMFWDVLDLYTNLRLICYGNDAGTWAHRARRSMHNHMLHAGLAPDAHMLGSVRALQGQSNNAEDEVADEDSRFCLPTFALSTPAFLAGLAKMGHSTPQQGGLRRDRPALCQKCVW